MDMVFKKSKGCHARVDMRMSWNGKCCGLIFQCSHVLSLFLFVAASY